MMSDDMELLREYASRQSEPAFEALAARHVGLVHSAALRQVRDPGLAEEITQTVFIILARKAGSLGPKTILPGWLYRTTRYVAAAALKAQRRRERREQEAHMLSTPNETQADAVWEQLAPLLDEAMAQLRDQDRDALVLRFFQNKSLRDVGAALGLDEYAAQKRVGRTLEKLRRFFTKRGVVLPAAVLTAAISANSVQAAPALLAKTATAVAITKGAAASGSTLMLVKGALKLMAWAKAQTAIVIGTAVLFAAGTTTVVVNDLVKNEAAVAMEDSSLVDVFLSQFDGYMGKVPIALFVRSTHFPLKNGVFAWRGGPLADAAGRNVTSTDLFTVAYGFKPARMILPPGVPTNHFDFLATLPNCPNEIFQAAIKNTLGWTAHTEMRETNVLLLKVKIADAPRVQTGATTNLENNGEYSLREAPGLIRGVATNHGSRCLWGGNVYHATNMPISDLREFLEDEIFHQPVLDQTGLTNKYDIVLDWQWSPDASRNHDSLKKVLLEQLGLELVPDRKRIEMLVVEQAKK